MKRLRFREDLSLKLTSNGCEIHGTRGIKFVDLSQSQCEWIRLLWEKGVTVEESKTLAPSEVAVLKTLKEHNLLRIFEDGYSRDEIWLSHYVVDARQKLTALSRREVMIVGCGGTGAIIADHLARAGVKKFILIDGAKLDEPDLNRQWTYSLDQVGEFKAELLKAHLEKQGAITVAHSMFIEKSEDLQKLAGYKPDLIICCADKPRITIETLILEMADKNKSPVLFGSVGVEDDQVGPLVLTAEDRSKEWIRLCELQNRTIETQSISGSMCFTNTLAAAKIGLAAYKFLTGISLRKS